MSFEFFDPTLSADLGVDDQEFFEENESLAGGTPYIQSLTCPNEDVIDVKDARPWGFYLNEENAQAINFVPDSNWSPVTFYTVEGQGFDKAVLEIPERKRAAYEKEGLEITEHKGYRANTLMFHLIYQSSAEVERKGTYQGKTSFQFVGLRYQGDAAHRELMEALLSERDEKNRPTHRWCQRYLLILVGANGQPLHDGVLAWKAKGGAGGSFGAEMRQFFQDLDHAWGEGKGNSRLRMIPKGSYHAGDSRSFVRVAMDFDLYKGGADSAPYLVPVSRVLPTGNPADLKDPKTKKPKVIVVTRGRDDERTATLITSLLIHEDKDASGNVVKRSSHMLVPQASPTGARIREAIAEYESWPLPMQGKEMAESGTLPNGDVAYSGSGFINAASIGNFNDDGSTVIEFVTDKGLVPLLISADHAEILDHENLTVKGIIPADGGPVTVTEWQGDRVTGTVAPDADAAPVAEQGSLVAAGDW